MCKFHQDVARAIATDPTTGQIDPLLHSLAMTATARFWIRRYIPSMADLDGYSNYEMARIDAARALKDSGLDTDVIEIDRREKEYAPQLRRIIIDIIKQQDLNHKKLGLPENYFLRQPALDNAMVSIYEGDPAKALYVKKTLEAPRFEQIRCAMEAFYDVPGIAEKMERMVKDSIARRMVLAQSAVNPQFLEYYEVMPKPLRTAFSGCAMHGAGVPLAVHGVTCGLPLLAGGGSGLMLSGLAASFGVPAIAAALDSAITHLSGRDISVSRAAIVFATAVGISTGAAAAIEYALPHEHLSSDKIQVLESLTKEQRNVFLSGSRNTYQRLPPELRERVDEAAAKEGVTPDIYLYGCDFSDELGQAVMAEIRKWKDLDRTQSASFRVAKP